MSVVPIFGMQCSYMYCDDEGDEGLKDVYS